MSTTPIVPAEKRLTRYFRSADPVAFSQWSIALRYTIRSDAARLFEALTCPEYLETWITIPGDDDSSYLVAWQQNGGFQFDHYHQGKRDRIIHGSWRICRRRKLLFTWRMKGENDDPESLVYIGLQGNFANTVLELHHRGITGASSRAWHEEMWTRSLDRLTRLFLGVNSRSRT